MSLLGQAEEVGKSGAESSNKDKGMNQTTNSDQQQSIEQPCRENYDAEVGACEQATLKAASACDENGSGLSAAMNAITEVSVMAGQKSAAGIQESCSKMGRVAQAANVAVMGYRQLCGTSVTSTALFSRPMKPCTPSSRTAAMA
ncbi:hypothetical protein ACNH6C_04745 [Bdellovibrio bacteriovorus]|uniref:hypothetical protein n=1 Tax=Bdellovibrio bacteriovorus TaxID=959 RepID=UPI003A803F41